MRTQNLRAINLPASFYGACDVLKLKQKGAALIYDLAEWDEASVHVRGALPTTDFTSCVIHIRESNFEGDKEGIDFPAGAVSLSAAGGIKAVEMNGRFLIVVVTTAGTGSNDEEAEVAVVGKVRDE